MTFDIGSLAKLKSGGPSMTIQAIDGDSVTCFWFDKNTLKLGKFHVASIEANDVVGDLLKSINEGNGA